MISSKNEKITYVITIDGPAGSGKSTIAKKLACLLGFTYLDTGAMFRAITLKGIEKKIDLEDEIQVLKLIQNTVLTIESLPSGSKVLLDGKDVSLAIRHPNVSKQVKYIAKMKETRLALCELQRRFAQGKKIIAEGRDMGTVVFPEASRKIYLSASLEERVRRRAKDMLHLGCMVSKEEIREEISGRDYEDSNRKVAPLRPATDAILIDTTGMSIEEVTTQIYQLVS